MLATATLALLLFEVFAFGGPALAFANRYDWPLWAVGPFIIFATLLSWLVIVLRTFIASARFTTEEPATRRIGLARWLRLIYKEWLNQTAILHVFMPFNKRFNQPDSPLSAKGMPVLLVHGLVCNGAAWWWMRKALVKRGIDRCYTIDLEPILGNIDDYARQLAQRVEDICAETGWSKILLVTHSMGGLVSRSYLQKLDGAHRVAGLVTIGTPHHGTALATIPLSENLRQLQLNDRWLADLNRNEIQPTTTPITSIYTAHDNLVSPQASCRLAHAENVRLVGIGHVTLMFSDEVADLVSEFVKRHS